MTAEAFLLHVRQTRCTRCGAVHTSSELFGVEPHATVRKLLPAKEYLVGMPLEKILLPVRTTPICHACVDTAPTPDFESYTKWKRAAEARARATSAPPTPTGPMFAGPARPAKPITDLA